MKRLTITAAAVLLAMPFSLAQATGFNETPPGQPAITPQATAITAIAAVINTNGNVVRAKAGTTTLTDSAGSYRVHFAVNVSGCVFTGNLGAPGSSGVARPGYLTVAGDSKDANGVFVQTYNYRGVLTPEPFHLLVSC